LKYDRYIEGNMRKIVSYIIIIALALSAASAGFAVSGNPLSFGYAGGTGKGDSTSEFDENAWSYKYQYHVLVLSGDIPQGSLFSQMQLEERDNKTGLAYAKFAISGSSYAINLGDNTENFSDITLNSLRYQGASVTLKPSNNLNFTVVGGARGNGMWGADVRRDTRQLENFTGLKTEYLPGGGLGLKAIYLTTQTGISVLSYGSEYVINDLKFGAEYGSANEGKAFQGEVKYQNSWLLCDTIFRDVDPTYIVPFDYMTYRGAQGTYSNVGIKPSKDMTINLQNNSYIDRLNCSTPEAMLDQRGDISYNLSTGTNIGYSGWRNDRQSEERGELTEGEIMYITQTFYLLTKNAVYYRVQPTWFNSSSSSEASYSEEKNVTGLNISLFDIAHLNYEIENATRLVKNTDVSFSPTAITARLDLFESQIMDSPFYISSSINYRRELPDREETSLEATSTYSDLTLKYIPDKDLSCYITAKVTNVTAPDIDRAARQQIDMSFGVNYAFNTSFYLK
jgi:hypothetical protein